MIYGGTTALIQELVGGPYDDTIISGSDSMGAIRVFGDKDNVDALNELPDTFNKYDGNDIIDIGDNNAIVKVYGQGGNDKILGGYGVE